MDAQNIWTGNICNCITDTCAVRVLCTLNEPHKLNTIYLIQFGMFCVFVSIGEGMKRITGSFFPSSFILKLLIDFVGKPERDTHLPVDAFRFFHSNILLDRLLCYKWLWLRFAFWTQNQRRKFPLLVFHSIHVSAERWQKVEWPNKGNIESPLL